MNQKQWKRLLEVSEWYSTISQEQRMLWQNEFGEWGVPDREVKFLRWLNKHKYSNRQGLPK